MDELSIKLDADRLEADLLVRAAREFLSILRSTDAGVTGKERLRWRLVTLSFASPAVFGVAPEPTRGVDPVVARQVAAAVFRGVRGLEEGERERTPLPDAALEHARRLAGFAARLRSLELQHRTDGRASTQRITARSAASVEEFIGARFESTGAIQGRLELISSHRGLVCNIYDRETGKAVRCFVPPEPEDLRQRAIAVFDRPVIAFGRISRDASGIARRMVLENVELLQEGPPPPRTIAGLDPGFGDGHDIGDFLDWRWK